MAKPKRGMTCEIVNCYKPVKGDGFCCAHYSRKLRHGDPLGGGPTRGFVLEWIKQNADYSGRECLTWPFHRGPSGYGQLTHKMKVHSASRFMLVFVTGEDKGKGFECLHSCGNGHLGCVNPKHLRWGTPTENNADKIKHGTLLQGSKIKASKLTESDVIKIRERILSGEPKKSIAKSYGVVGSVITKIDKRYSWKHV